jgi:2-polyprenyl-3-methyl-5-hydroxy-6-metoxy-1,4-benzoquinol methylase
VDIKNRKRVAELNKKVYASNEEYVSGAPHLKHATIRKLHYSLITKVYNRVKLIHDTPKILDLGAGEGSVTSTFLELGGAVTAVDISREQLEVLQGRCSHFKGALTICCNDIYKVLENENEKYNIITFNSFLHHIPDYIDLINRTLPLLKGGGQLFAFQDPMRYDTMKVTDLLFTNFSYFIWRVFQDDAIRGMARWLRRRVGVYKDNSMHDNAEYHVVRNGVDQEAIQVFLEGNLFKCEIVTYFSTQNATLQRIGEFFKFKNTFAVVAEKL